MLKYFINKVQAREIYAHSGDFVDYNVGDIVIMKKPHPCGCREFEILRVGVDFKLKCTGCGREVMVPRIKALKSIKKKTEGNS